MLFHAPMGGEVGQTTTAADTTDTPHINIVGTHRFDEWNKAFDQSPV